MHRRRSQISVAPHRPWWERVVFAAGIIAVPIGIALLALMPWIGPGEGREKIGYVVFAISLIKFSILAGVWWLITRHVERPDLPGIWGPEEQQMILDRIRQEAEVAKAQGDGATLRHLAREAWMVADRLEGEIKGEAVALASVLGAHGQMTPRG